MRRATPLHADVCPPAGGSDERTDAIVGVLCAAVFALAFAIVQIKNFIGPFRASYAHLVWIANPVADRARQLIQAHATGLLFILIFAAWTGSFVILQAVSMPTAAALVALATALEILAVHFVPANQRTGTSRRTTRTASWLAASFPAGS